MKKGNRYLKTVEWSDENHAYVGSCPGLMLGGVHGSNEQEVYKKLCQVVDEWIEIYEKDGSPLAAPTSGRNYSGKFVLRTGTELHKSLVFGALKNNKSLNEYCVSLLRESTEQYNECSNF